MARTSKTPTATTLQTLSSRGATGRLSLGAGASEASVFLLDGEVVAVRSADDAAVLAERLAHAGAIPLERARQLQAMQAMSLPILGRDGSDPILGLLLDQLDGPEVDAALDARFDEVLGTFLGQPGEPVFEADATPWAHLVRTAGDTAARLRRLSAWITAAAVIDPRRVLDRGATAPESDEDELLWRALSRGPLTAQELVAALGWPDTPGRGRIAQALERAVVVDAPPAGAVHEPDPAPTPVEVATPDPIDHAGADAEPTVEVSRFRVAAPAPPDDTHVAAPVPSDDDATEAVDHDALEAFSGVDDDKRGGSRDGTFVQDAASLDRVELVEVEEPAAAREGPGYSAPQLSEEDAFDKLGVANEVLRTVWAALAAAHSSDEARATLQVLVDGRPRVFASLFEGLVVAEDGAIPFGPLLVNLRRRLPTEQRHLLNQGLLDLLDQTLDRAADDLDPDAFDELLERVIGYRQRLGL